MSESLFNKRYSELNLEQKEAVDSIDGPVMVIAGPGTGKTSILTLRIANILKKTDTPASGILAITYTDAGVRAMREKLRAIIGGRAHEVGIFTFHGFASSMIAEYPEHFLHLEGMRQLSDVDQEIIIREILEDKAFKDLRPMGRPDAYIGSILKTIDEAKREALTSEEVKDFAKVEIERIKNDESSISTRGKTKGKLKAEAENKIEKCKKTILFAEVFKIYEKKKKETGYIDFNDLINELLVTLKENELFLRLIQERFLYILIDEHQDTNDAQNLIIALVSEFFDTPNIFIVGDEKQAIYRFQGASVENFMLLKKRWPKMKVISLSTNYRSHQSLLSASFSMIENNYEDDEHQDLRIKLLSGSQIKSREIEIVTGEDSSAMEGYLVEKIREILKSDKDATVAVITRRNRDLERVIRVFESNLIPVSSQRSVDIFHHPVGAMFFELCEFLADQTRFDSLAKTIAAGMWNLPFDDRINFIKELRSGKIENFDKSVKALSEIRNKMNEDGPLGFIVHSAEISGLTSIIASNPSRIYVWRGIIALSESLIRESAVYSPLELLSALLSYKKSAELRPVKVSVGAPDLPVRAMTAHSSKGLEFDYVFITYATEESWVGRARGTSFIFPNKSTSEHDIRDARRLFYVALTRAKKHATILNFAEELDGKSQVPLRFISEIDPVFTKSISLPRAGAKLPEKNVFLETGTKNNNQKILDEAKNLLLGNGLSVTALNHFIECPNKFIYESVLKMPQAPSITAVKGTAMHEAISSVWINKNKKSKDIERTLFEITERIIDDSLLPINDKESISIEFEESIPTVALSLQEHFNSQGQIFTERWVKSIFDGKYEKQDISIQIHGKLDALIDDGREVFVYDYKTRQNMSSAEIKGETKNSNGNYFRQLVFYKILLDGNFPWKGKTISPFLVFTSPDKKGRCPIVSVPISDNDTKDLKINIQKVIDDIWSGEVLNKTCGKDSCEYCKLSEISV